MLFACNKIVKSLFLTIKEEVIMKLNKIKLAVLGALMVPLTTIHAEEAAPAAESGFSFSANVGLFSDYIWRGQSQTQRQPALQGGFDVEHSSGFYAGVWASNVEWTSEDATVGGNDPAMKSNSLEIDGYLGYAFELAGIGFDLGVLQYYYPGHVASGNPETDATEIYAGIGYDFGVLSVGYTGYYTVSDEAWAVTNADGTMYHDFSVEAPVGDSITVSAHYGIFDFDSSSSGTDWNDWKVNVEYAINDVYAVGAFYTDTDEDSIQINGKDVNDDTVGAYLTASF